MCPHQQWLNRTMARLHFATTIPVLPPINTDLMVLRIKIFKRKYNYTYGKVSQKMNIRPITLEKWIQGKYKPTQANYNYVMNYLDNHM